ncbi:MAG: DUF503 domain-containing protein [Candidatus Aminicenantales bacterium]
MVVGVLTLEIHFPYARSLKDKRHHLKGFKDRVRNKHNVALAEIDFQDKWQRALVAVATVNSAASVVEDLLNRILREAEESVGGTVVGHRIDLY